MIPAAVHLLVPGPLGQPTGGYRYDARIVAGLRDAGVRVSVHELKGAFPLADLPARRAVASALRRAPDGAVVVLDGLCLAAAVALRGERRRIAAVALVHHPAALETGWPAPAMRRLARAERAALRSVRRVIATSAHTARGLVADYGMARDRVAVVEPGVDRPTPGKSARTEARDPTPRLVCVGAVTRRKGHATLVDALTRIADRPWHLVCYGSLDRHPELVEQLRRQLVQAGLVDRVTLAGVVDDATLAAGYAAADLMVHAAHYEGYGMVLTEAVAHGLPVVATAAGATAETLPAGAGLLVPPGDPAALAVALAAVLDDPAKRAALAAAAARARDRLPRWPAAVRLFAAELARARRDR